MAEYSVVARPYASAIFELAQAENNLSAWSEKLYFASEVIKSSEIRAIIQNPSITKERKLELLLSILAENVDTSFQNLLHLLIDNRRLFALPAIYTIYEEYRAEAEKTTKVEVVTAYTMTNEQIEVLKQKLSTKFNTDIELDIYIDASILGGAIIRSGDMVIDGSVRGKLEHMKQVITR